MIEYVVDGIVWYLYQYWPIWAALGLLLLYLFTAWLVGPKKRMFDSNLGTYRQSMGGSPRRSKGGGRW